MAEIDNLIAEVNKKYKTDIIRKASDLKGIEFIPYTSPMMNYLTRGGVPVGRIIELVGLPQSGKTTTALDIISNFQKKYTDKYCVYLDAENTIDKEWGETLGVDWSKVILIQPESEYGEELLDMLLDYIRSGKVGLAVLDSAPFIIPKAVQEKGLDEKSYGGNSALMKAFCDKAVPLCKKTECTFLMINQLRENIGNPYKPFKIPCGTAIAHACSQILWFTKGSLLDEKYKEVSSGYANPSGHLVSVKVEKNKVTKNDRRLQTYTLNYSTGVDEIKDTLDLAIMLGIISQAGAWYKATLKDGKEQKMQGFNGVQEFYYNDLEELEYLRKQVYEAGMV
ncbi:RecA/RadA recombinase [Agathobacter rectalis]|uniref:RecA/RadA recombinase n=1 Tax=Agathobacter rectalis TaxID=39491 RepID=UPI0001CD258C|nr:RecA/RadA recombinase [Agathobacter rectalis]CBK91884.1 RecA/RadA recombinase [Agathobacter rectalis DSM 17629]